MKIKYLFVVFVILQLLDAITTIVGISILNVATEANSIANGVMDIFGVVGVTILFKVIALLLVVVTYNKFSITRVKELTYFFYIVIVIISYVVINNLSVILG